MLNHNFTLWVVFPGILIVGCYFTWKLRFIQLTKLKTSFSCLTSKDTQGEGSISRFGAISAVLAGNFGTGNISGMAVALTAGGPGALVWMWIMAFLGAAIQYASCLLGNSFRKKMSNGEYAGGPMYYLRDGLRSPKLAICFAFFTLFGAFTVGNLAQVNSIILPLQKLGFNPLYCGIVIALFVGLVTLGGIKRLANFASYIVPFKAVLYLGTAFTIIALHHKEALSALELMLAYAFNASSVVGGALGFGMLKMITTGFDRGLFATDAGTGIVPIVQANAKSSHPALDGIASLLAPFMVMVVCTATGIVLILTQSWLDPSLQSTNMVTHAFAKGLGSSVGSYIVIITLMLFAYTTILAWSYCGEKALEFLVGETKRNWFAMANIAIIPLGTMMQVGMIWTLADIAITLMLFINLIGIVRLRHHIVTTTKDFVLGKSRAASA